MLHIVAWLAVYAVVLFMLGQVIRPWRTRRWFKAIFLPGVLIAIGVQAAAARLCVGGHYKTAPLKAGEFAFSIEKDVPCLAGALFVFVSHVLFYALFFFTVRQLETIVGLEVEAISLPGLHPHQVLEGTIEVDARAYLASLRRSVDLLVANPLPYLALLYLAAPMFANFKLHGRELFWAMLLVIGLGYSVSFADHLEMGFPLLSRGWWAGFFVFPQWWGIFSLYVTAALLTLALAVVPALGRLLVRTMKSDEGRSERADQLSERAGVAR